jgi:hypothetical protein
MSSPAPDRTAIAAEFRAVMTEIIELTRQQLEAMIRGDHKAFKSLESDLERSRSHKEALLRVYQNK